MSIGPATIPGIYQIEDSGGVTAPEKRVEDGFDFTTRVGPEPIEVSISAWVDGADLGSVKTLRAEREPVPVRVGSVSLGQCVLDDLSVDEEGERYGAYDCTMDLREVQIASTGTATLHVASETGSKSESAGKGGKGGNIAQSGSESGGSGGGGGGLLSGLGDSYSEGASYWD